MKQTRRATATAVAIVTTALLSGTAGVVQAAPADTGSGSGSGRGAAADGRSKTVTLVTGDRVTLDAAGRVAGVTAGKGREHTRFRISRAADGHTHVVPGDAERLIADGTADRRLFDVTRLVSEGYDDASRPDLPLIVTYAKGRSVAARALSESGARVSRDLPSVDGDALRARKSQATALWRTLTGGGAASRSAAAGSAEVARIWLDAKVKASADPGTGTAQIGAPEAWAAGYDGKGVTVAVLDTGVDATHPDLKDRVGAEKNFSESPDTVDRVGHGTHVASIVAGSGAKSDGKFQGVAPGARLIVGKVLDDSGTGYDSGIIAGMQWAVAQGAKVVNLSLGGQDSPETDPIEQAVNDLSADSGTLFVVAAGNEGPGAGTIGTPGSAAAALTVGAVDRTDAIAEFSSRGPAVDGSLKPDLTAPGVDIVAAKAAEGVEGDPAADGYVSMSGTSMATPHVAGAAAIIAQEHPDWTGERIKAALTGSAVPAAGLSAFAQGTGRTDVARAIRQQVSGSPSLGFGTAQWPHADDRPVTKEITYRNDGDRPVTLDLAAEAFGEDGKPAAEGMFEVTPKQLTVPAGGTATAAVTADTRAGTADGAFGGSVTATAGDISVRTAIGVDREVESYNLTVRHLDLRGKPTGWSETGVYALDGDVWQDYSDPTDGEFTVRLPKGRYTLEGRVSTGTDPDDGKLALLLHPKFALTRDTTLVMDARKADPVRISVPDKAARNTEATLNFGIDDDGARYTATYVMNGFADLRVGQFGARLPARQAFAQYDGTWTHGAVHYRPAWNRTGDLSGFTAKLRRQDFAKLDITVGEPAPGKTANLSAAPLTPGGSWYDFSQEQYVLPRTVTDYVLPGVKWRYAVDQYGAPDADGEPVWEGRQTVEEARAYTAGKRYTQRFNIGVFGPHLSRTGEEASGAVRRGDSFAAYVPLFSDGAGHGGVSDYSKAKSALYADGKAVFTSDTPLNGDDHTLPAGRRTYRLFTDVSRPASLSAVSTRVTAEWTFRSGHVAGDTAKWLPLSVVRFSPRLGTASTAKAGAAFTVPFTVEGAATARTARKLAFAVSYDDGRTWRPAKVVDRDRLELRHPARPGTVSLRVTLTDAAGNTVKQTIHRAYRTTK
ncbi:S8 family peptidase [Streptomyces sp. NPDC058691]|uniref:S8 family peptidase n=1 Tax=Streptomyces sp. NPDC058691 TaxID=3346601 RepID=UPI00364EB23F